MNNEIKQIFKDYWNNTLVKTLIYFMLFLIIINVLIVLSVNHIPDFCNVGINTCDAVQRLNLRWT